MARYNTAVAYTTSSGATTLNSPFQGQIFVLTGAAPYTVTLSAPGLFIGQPQTFYNSTGGVVTLASPSGNIYGPGFTTGTTQAMANGTVYTLVADGTGYLISNNEGGPISTSSLSVTGAVTLSPTSASVTISPSGANVTISPTAGGNVTINPNAAGTINNMSIGQTTAAAGTFSALTASGTATLQQITEVIVPISSYGTSQSTAWTNSGNFFLSGMTGNFTFNLTGVPTTAGRTITVTLWLSQGGTAYVPTTFQINSSTVTINWAGGITPSGRANKNDVVSLYCYYNGSAWTVLGSLGSYG